MKLSRKWRPLSISCSYYHTTVTCYATCDYSEWDCQPFASIINFQINLLKILMLTKNKKGMEYNTTRHINIYHIV